MNVCYIPSFIPGKIKEDYCRKVPCHPVETWKLIWGAKPKLPKCMKPNLKKEKWDSIEKSFYKGKMWIGPKRKKKKAL